MLWSFLCQWRKYAVASPRGGGSGAICPPPPQPPIGHPVRSMQIRGDFRVEKMGVGLQYLLLRFTCTDATADVASVATTQLTQTDTMQLRLVRRRNGGGVGISVLACALPNLTFLLIFYFYLYCDFGSLPKIVDQIWCVFSFWQT